MPSALFEIVQLTNGAYALQQVGTEDEPLLKIEFSQEAMAFLEDQDVQVARAMIGAAIRTVGQMKSFDVTEEAMSAGDLERALQHDASKDGGSDKKEVDYTQVKSQSGWVH